MEANIAFFLILLHLLYNHSQLLTPYSGLKENNPVTGGRWSETVQH